MSETGDHSPSQPAEQHGEDLLPEPGQEEAQVRHLHTFTVEAAVRPPLKTSRS